MAYSSTQQQQQPYLNVQSTTVLQSPTPVASPSRLNRMMDQRNSHSSYSSQSNLGDSNSIEMVGTITAPKSKQFNRHERRDTEDDDDEGGADFDMHSESGQHIMNEERFLDSQLALDNLIQAKSHKMSNTSNIDEKSRKRRSEGTSFAKLFPRFAWSARIFLINSVISAIIILVFESFILAMISRHQADFNRGKYTEISMYVSIFIFAMVFQIMLTYIGLKTKNYLLILMLLIFYGCMIIFCGIQYKESRITLEKYMNNEKTKRLSIRIINIIMIGLTGGLFIVQVLIFYFRLRKTLEFARYYKIGGDLRIRHMYNIFQIHRSLVIFDFFFFTGFLIQFLVVMDTKKHGTYTFVLAVILLPVSVIVVIVSDISTCRELWWGTLMSSIMFVGGIAFVIYKLVMIYTKYNSVYGFEIVPGSYFPGRISLTIFAIINLVLFILSLVFEVLCLRNYNKGLIEKVSGYYGWIGRKHPGNEVIDEDTMKDSRDEEEMDDRDYDDDDDEISIN